jgi:hypothetical protein
MPDTLHALRRAIAAVKAGDKAAGQRLLAEVIRGDPRNEAAWLWMAAALDSDEQRRTCLERVLAINPDNPAARRGLARLGPSLGGASPTGPASQAAGLASPGPRPEPNVPPLAGNERGARAASEIFGHAVGARRAAPLRRGRTVLSGWSLLIAFGATVAVCATAGIAAYLALSGAVSFLRSRVVRSIGPCSPVPVVPNAREGLSYGSTPARRL